MADANIDQSAALCAQLIELFLANDISGLQARLRATEFLKTNCKRECSNYLPQFNIHNLVSTQSSYKTAKRRCQCSRRKFIGALLGESPYEGEYGTAEYVAMRAQHLHTLQELFASGDISHEHISDSALLDFLDVHLGCPYNDKVLIFLLNVIPPKRWAGARSYDQGFTAMHRLAYGLLGMEMLRPHILKLLDMGCDPQEQGVCETILYAFTCLHVDAEMVRLLTSKYKLNVNEITYQPSPKDCEAQFDLAVSHGAKETQMMRLLKFNQYAKNEERLSRVKTVISILLAAGYDLTYKIPAMTAQEKKMYKQDRHTGEGCTIYDYIITYGWVEFLKDTLPIQKGYIHTPVVDEYEQSARLNRFAGVPLAESLAHTNPVILVKYNVDVRRADESWIIPMIQMRHCKDMKQNADFANSKLLPELLAFLKLHDGKCAYEADIESALVFMHKDCYGFDAFPAIRDAMEALKKNYERYRTESWAQTKSNVAIA